MPKVYDVLAYAHRLYNDQKLDQLDVSIGLETLNAMLESWAVDGSAIFKRTREEFAVGTGDSWTIGPGGDLDTVRPIKVLTVQYQFGGTGWPLSEMTPDDWEAQAGKSSLVGQSRWFYYEHGYPLSTLHVWPQSSAATLTVISTKPLAAYTSHTQDLGLPPGYYNAVAYNLAVMLAPQEGKEVPRSTEMQAKKFKAQLARLFYTVPTITPDGPKGGDRQSLSENVSYGNLDDWNWSP